MKRPPRLVRICVFVLLLGGGAIINVAVAWIAGAVFYDGSRPDCIIETGGAKPTELANVSVCIANTWAATRIDVSENFSRSGNFRHVLDLTSAVPHWLRRFTNSSDLAKDNYDQHAVYACGWPLRSMFGCMRINFGIGPDTLHGDWVIILPPPSPMRNDQSRLLPLLPLWPGFAINSVFYAVILWLLFAAPFALRRRRRIKRGLCPNCAYDLRGSPRGGDATTCPECGAA